MKYLTKKHSKGFTLIELLVVITIIGVLSGVVLRVVNVQRQKDVASDAVKRSNVEKISMAIEAFVEVEGVVPDDANGNQDPLDDYPTLSEGSRTDGSAPNLRNYLKSWPGEAAEYRYAFSEDAFMVFTNTSLDPNKYFKYYSDWGTVKDCDAVQPIDACENGITGNEEL